MHANQRAPEMAETYRYLPDAVWEAGSRHGVHSAWHAAGMTRGAVAFRLSGLPGPASPTPTR
jgi:hypothetical protein